eukprot:c10845_g1_i2.p1 GENE.c10845_g1_i2~~c10845_g1_i2.p1  ORF type:complete len:348 (-),score=47.39 c10845_g1_i2:43-1086(-)
MADAPFRVRTVRTDETIDRDDSVFRMPGAPAMRMPAGAFSDMAPLRWSECFDKELMLEIPAGEAEHEASGTYRVLLAGESGSLLVFLHGAGSSAVTWARIVHRLRTRNRCLAFDFRGHGHTVANNASDLSVAALVSDLMRVLSGVFARPDDGSPDAFRGALPPVVLVGHSMGGAIATRAAAAGAALGLAVSVLAVVDVVEGTAMASLPIAREAVAARPQAFASESEAIQWHLSSRTLRSSESARISVPDILSQGADRQWVWRTDLAATEPFWCEWYSGLSQSFLSVHVPRLLILADTDRLDKDLTIAHMQGKLKLAVVSPSGHFVHEDDPGAVAAALGSMLDYYRLR